MKTVKMSLANIQGKLSRNEMKQISAGSGDLGTRKCDVCKGYMPACCYSTVDCCYDSQGRCCNK